MEPAFRPDRISTTEQAKQELSQSFGLSNIDEADQIDESVGEASPEPEDKFTMWDV
jgi:hypothetical protein